MSAVLALNAGSSSLKLALFLRGDPPIRSESGSMERSAGARLIEGLVSFLQRNPSAMKGLEAVGHRVVHGGPRFLAPMRVTPELLGELRRISPFDPEHLPAQIGLIEACAAT